MSKYADVVRGKGSQAPPPPVRKQASVSVTASSSKATARSPKLKPKVPVSDAATSRQPPRASAWGSAAGVKPKAPAPVVQGSDFLDQSKFPAISDVPVSSKRKASSAVPKNIESQPDLQPKKIKGQEQSRPQPKSNKPKPSSFVLGDLIATTKSGKPVTKKRKGSSALPDASTSHRSRRQTNTTKLAVSGQKPLQVLKRGETAGPPFLLKKNPEEALESRLRAMDGEEHDLLRLFHDGKITLGKKGRQRIRPRRKKFSTLKKKVLYERLQRWRDTHPEESSTREVVTSPTVQPTTSDTVCLHGFVEPEELEDSDEYEELVSNLRDMAVKVGRQPPLYVFIPRNSAEDLASESHPVFVRFSSHSDCQAAVACWDGLVVGGQRLEARILPLAPHDGKSTSGKSEEQQWQEHVVHASSKDCHCDVEMPDAAGTVPSTTTIVLHGILTQDDYDDEDCLEESIADIKNLLSKHLAVLDTRVGTERGSLVVVCDQGADIVQEALLKLKDVVIGGARLMATVASNTAAGPNSEASRTVCLENVLTKDDFEDEECMEESLSDVRRLAELHGKVSEVRVQGETVCVVYDGEQQAVAEAANKLNGAYLGGSKIVARCSSSTSSSGSETNPTIVLSNLLTDDDLEDEDCLNESLVDVRELAEQYGKVVSVDVEGRTVKVEYRGSRETVERALSGFNGMVIGGQKVLALMVSAPAAIEPATMAQETGPTAKEDEPPSTMFIRGKRVPESFAECKRAPKIPNAGVPRKYATLLGDDSVKPLLIEMLGELMRLQKRAIQEKNSKVKRRIVMGLREVARGIRSHKVKLVCMANNLDEYGAIDEKLQEIIDLAQENNVPLFYEFSKRTLGKAVGKTIKIAVVGVQNTEGAHQQFSKLVTLASKYSAV